MTIDQFKTQEGIYFNQGFRITAFEFDNGRVAAVWKPGNGAQWVRWGLTREQLHAQDQTFFGEGLRLTSVEPEKGRYAGVWRPGSGTQWVRSRRCFADLQAEDAIFFQQGLRFGLIEPDEPGVGAYSYPWKSGVTYKVNQGNDTAPPDSHNGVQKYAFDFDLPVGTEIRAAREGTVERVREDLPDSYNSATVNIPGRVLANWGNYLRIRHADGTTSWYFHLRNNGVTVNVNDVVQKGQPIAISSNTGRSTGAHLHFQVQPDSTNWGQTIPIAFQNCETPGKNTKVTSDNANASFP